MVTKPTVLPAQTSMCESVRLWSVNDMCHDLMQRRTATLKDRKVHTNQEMRGICFFFRFSTIDFIQGETKAGNVM